MKPILQTKKKPQFNVAFFKSKVLTLIKGRLELILLSQE